MHTERNGRAGFTLLEVTISATILFLLAAMMVEAMDQIGSLGRSGGTAGRLQLGAADAMTRIAADLRCSGFVSANGKDYPYLFEDGAAVDPDFTDHAHVPAAEHAQPGQPDEGVNREIVLAQPAFITVAQGDDGLNYSVNAGGVPQAMPVGVSVVKYYSVPDIAGDGSAIWSADEVSYVLVTRGRRRQRTPASRQRCPRNRPRARRGTNPVRHEHHRSGGAFRCEQCGCACGCACRTREGTVHRHFAEAVVRLQNGVLSGNEDRGSRRDGGSARGSRSCTR